MSDIENIECPLKLQLEQEFLDVVKRKAKYNAMASIFSPIAIALSKLSIEPKWADDGLNVYFSGDKDKLTKALRILRTAGFATSNDRPKPGDTSWSAWFGHKDTTLQIWFHFSSTVCQRVKVGTRMQEVDVYEVRCGDPIEIEVPAIDVGDVPQLGDSSQEPAQLSN